MIKKISDDNGQLLIVAGVLITILIIISATITVNLSLFNKPVDKSNFIRSDFQDIRADMGYLLNDILTPEMLELGNRDGLNIIFNDTVVQLKFAQSRHNYYFNAELIDIVSYSDSYDTLQVKLVMRNLYDSISEYVYYHIT